MPMYGYGYSYGAANAESAGVSDPLAAFDWKLRLQSHRVGSTVPLGYYQDDAATIPATSEFDIFQAWKDELSDSGQVLTQSDPDKSGILGFETSTPIGNFDGVDDFLKSALLGSPLSQPTTIFAVAKNTDTLGSNRQIISGQTDLTRQVVYNDGGNDSIYAGSVLGAAGTVEEWHVWTAIFDGASSILRIDGVQVAAGNAGAQGLDGFVLGSNFDSTGNFWAGAIIALCVLNEIPSLDNIELIESELTQLIP